MANEEQLAILRQGVDVWNKWREEGSILARRNCHLLYALASLLMKQTRVHSPTSSNQHQAGLRPTRKLAN